MKSKTVVFHPIIAALVEAEKIVGPNRLWQAKNYDQECFLSYFETCRDEIAEIDEIESIASWSYEEVMQFLTERGFGDMKLSPFDSDHFGIASVLNILLKWRKPGGRIPIITPEGGSFDGVKIGDVGVSFFTSSSHDNVIARLVTKSKDVVFLTMLSGLEGNDDPFSILDAIYSIRATMTPCFGYSGVHFPMVDLDQDVDVDWLSKMKTEMDNGEYAMIGQALQKTRFKMNNIGAKVESAFAASVYASCCVSPVEPPPPLIINKPFLAWVERDGLQMPLFSGHIHEDCWKDPGDFGDSGCYIEK